MREETNPPAPTAPEEDSFGLERLIFFSDAVFAIAITLLALEIRLPVPAGELSDGQLARMLVGIWHKYLGFVISFLVIGAFWTGHHRKFRFIKRYDTDLILLNLLLLMGIAFIPFPTSILSENAGKTATIFYAMIIVATGLLNAAIWLYASRNNRLLAPDFGDRQRRHETLRALVVPAVFLLSIGLAFINADLAKYSWLLIAVAIRFV
ncbi:MAG: DUF1211 domain-containing protein [Anaerolineae bacterium]|nr:DUF1211 domain-containing protein [Anaerolineae bacterium]